MPERKLKKVLRAIEDAQHILTRAKNNIPENNDIRRAARELDDAESLVKKALREIRSKDT